MESYGEAWTNARVYGVYYFGFRGLRFRGLGLRVITMRISLATNLVLTMSNHNTIAAIRFSGLVSCSELGIPFKAVSFLEALNS